MNRETNIFILSQPIRSGKTTALGQAMVSRNDVGGFLTPDIDGIRQLYHISKNIYIPFEAKPNEPSVSIGKFKFSQAAFDYGNHLLINALQYHEKYLIVDEAGKLELQEKGFHMGIQLIIQYIQNHPGTYKLLIVVRDSLLEDMIKQYRIQNAAVIDSSQISTFFSS